MRRANKAAGSPPAGQRTPSEPVQERPPGPAGATGPKVPIGAKGPTGAKGNSGKPARGRVRERAGTPEYSGERLRESWDELHLGDREPWPDEARISRLARQHPHVKSWVQACGSAAEIAVRLQDAWRAFHEGDFRNAIELGSEVGPLGAAVANKAAAVHSLHARSAEAHGPLSLEEAIKRGDAAVQQLPEDANAHYSLALVLGRFSQRISILKALAEGLAGRVRSHLERAIELEPRHAEAHVAFGLYHAEIVNKLGGLAAALTYGASRDAALDHFRRAARLAPDSPIVQMEHANGLLLLDAQRNRDEAQALYARAAEREPLDAMEQLDVARAKRGIA